MQHLRGRGRKGGFFLSSPLFVCWRKKALFLQLASDLTEGGKFFIFSRSSLFLSSPIKHQERKGGRTSSPLQLLFPSGKQTGPKLICIMDSELTASTANAKGLIQRDECAKREAEEGRHLRGHCMLKKQMWTALFTGRHFSLILISDADAYDLVWALLYTRMRLGLLLPLMESR